jgi:hypothetical protein
MPNWCINNILFSGDRQNVAKLYEDWDTAIKTIAEGDDGWLGRLLIYKGIDPAKIYCRGFADCLELQDNGLFVITSDAWLPMFVFYDYVADLYGLQYVLMAEEPGNGIYINTDIEGRFFPERYIVEIVSDDASLYKEDSLINILRELSDERYFASFEPIAKYLTPYGVRTDEDIEMFRDFVAEKYPNVYFGFAKFDLAAKK